MDFDLGPDELALQQGIRDLCRGRFPMERVREGFSRDRWRELGAAGVFSLRLPEDGGGAGLGMTQAVIVFEELGRALVPGPLVASHLAAGVVEGAATGERVVGCAEAGDDVVEHVDALDALLVIDAGVRRVDPSTLGGTVVDAPLDPLTPLHHVHGLPRGEPLSIDAEAFRLHGAALTSALSVGIAASVTVMAVDYAKERQQFGRPIGSFQAVKHMCADMLVKAETARAAVYAAGVLLDDPRSGDPVRAVHAAKVVAGDAAVANGKACIQVHGGMGFTWEMDVHLYVKRAVVLATHFGGPDAHADAMASYL